MNVCSFTGFLLDDPIVEKQEGVSFLEFKLITYSYRRSKSTGEKTKIPTVLTFEAWHTGADTIGKLAQKGEKMTVFASARNRSRDNQSIIFRVNEFDFGCLSTKDTD